MKLSLFTIAFAALAATGLAAEDGTMEAAVGQVDTPSQRALREAALTEDNNVAPGAPELIEPEVEDNKRRLKDEGKAGTKKKRGLKKDYSGQGCRFCCDDDYHC